MYSEHVETRSPRSQGKNFQYRAVKSKWERRWATQTIITDTFSLLLWMKHEGLGRFLVYLGGKGLG